jgi:hypothetical protein
MSESYRIAFERQLSFLPPFWQDGIRLLINRLETVTWSFIFTPVSLVPPFIGRKWGPCDFKNLFGVLFGMEVPFSLEQLFDCLPGCRVVTAARGTPMLTRRCIAKNKACSSFLERVHLLVGPKGAIPIDTLWELYSMVWDEGMGLADFERDFKKFHKACCSMESEGTRRIRVPPKKSAVEKDRKEMDAYVGHSFDTAVPKLEPRSFSLPTEHTTASAGPETLPKVPDSIEKLVDQLEQITRSHLFTRLSNVPGLVESNFGPFNFRQLAATRLPGTPYSLGRLLNTVPGFHTVEAGRDNNRII